MILTLWATAVPTVRGSIRGSSLLIALSISNVTIIKDRISRWLVSGNDALSAICKEVLI